MFIFKLIGVLAMEWGLMNAAIAVTEQKEANKVNGRANELLRSMPTGKEEQKDSYALEPMMSALKDGFMAGVKAGIIAALMAYGVAESFAAIGRVTATVKGTGMAAEFTVLTALGVGSVEMVVAFLMGIAVSMAVGVLGAYAKENAEENVKKAYGNLFEAKRAKRDYMFAMEKSK